MAAGSNVPRICTWGVLQDKATKRYILIYNTHLDHESEAARKKGFEMIEGDFLEKMKQYQGALGLITGDFNGPPDLTRSPSLINAGRIATLTRDTFTFGGNRDLDYILAQKPITVTRSAVITRKDKKFLSDHNPLFADIAQSS